MGLVQQSKELSRYVSTQCHVTFILVLAMTALGDCFKRQRKLSDAERLLRGSLEIMKVVLPEDHLEVANSMCVLY